MCRSYFKREFIGLACEAFCVRKNLKLNRCPNALFHTGKDYVFSVSSIDNNLDNEFILKSSNLRLPIELNASDRALLINSIKQLVGETFKREFDINLIENLIPTNGSSINLASLPSLDAITLLNIYKLLQDNEYQLSMILNNVNHFKSSRILPRIISTCGNSYLVSKSNFIIDFTYLDQTHSTKDKLLISRKLIDFLISFQNLGIRFELCDVKYEHFGALDKNDNLILIDSDMIYHNRNVKENINAIQNCEKDADCDFNDCLGVCETNQTCKLNEQDNNLKRICRNLFFVDQSNLLDADNFGLLVNLDRYLNVDSKLIYHLCFSDSLINLKTNRIYLLNERIDSIRNILDKHLR